MLVMLASAAGGRIATVTHGAAGRRNSITGVREPQQQLLGQPGHRGSLAPRHT